MLKTFWLIFFVILKNNTLQNNESFDCFLKRTKFNDRVKEKLIRIYNWAKMQKKDLNIPSSKILLYPFGGGDILYPLILFSEIDEIVVIGLEPAGKSVQSNDSEGFLSLNLRVLYEMGFFRTKQMEHIRDYGVISLMDQQLRALRATDITIEFFERGFTIFFKLDEKNKKVTYHSMNLSNDHEEKWLKILDKYSDFSVFLKGASYILQQKNFDKIRDFLIKRSNVILQDDTGFRYSFLKDKKFEIHLFGYYFEPLESDDNFHVYFQKNLMIAYLNNEDVNVFDISYNEENWLFAIKKLS